MDVLVSAKVIIETSGLLMLLYIAGCKELSDATLVICSGSFIRCRTRKDNCFNIWRDEIPIPKNRITQNTSNLLRRALNLLGDTVYRSRHK